MGAKILDGKALSRQMRSELANEVESFTQSHGFAPKLVIFRAGDDPASVWYAKSIMKTAAKVGIEAVEDLHPESASQDELVQAVADLSADDAVHGIILQEPFPEGVSGAALVAALDPSKDVDGVHPVNAGRLLRNEPGFVPATPLGGLKLLERNDIPIKGARAVVVGRSDIVGKPMALLLLHRHATVTICHSRTKDLAWETRHADILVAAVGRARMITGDMIKPGAVVIDFGTNYEGDKLVGDVDFDSAQEVAGFITPVPGGTGPMTTVMLLWNVLSAAKAAVGG